MKILFIGDLHGRLPLLHEALEHSIREKIDIIINLGDFGFQDYKDVVWGEQENFLLEQSNSFAQLYDKHIFFVDGNHENFDHLLSNEYHDCDLNLPDCNLEQLKEIRSNIHYIPRGAIFSIGKITMMGFGGAYSVDRNRRTIYKSWWPQEEPSQQDLQYAIDNWKKHNKKKINLLLCHDTVQEADFDQLLATNGSHKKELIPEADRSRRMVSTIVKQVRPNFLMHGHYHRNAYYEISYDGFHVSCLGLDQVKPKHINQDVNEFYFVIDSKITLERIYS